MYYLAYGSNMAKARLQNRIPSAQRLGLVTLMGHRLTFDNLSTKDGTGKCDALRVNNPDDSVIAVLYQFDSAAKPILDSYEGLGVEYRDAYVRVESPSGKMVEALIYYATNLQPGIKPFHWYKQHVLYGAEENHFPDHYVDTIRQVESMEDPDHCRAGRELSIYATGRHESE